MIAAIQGLRARFRVWLEVVGVIPAMIGAVLLVLGYLNYIKSEFLSQATQEKYQVIRLLSEYYPRLSWSDLAASGCAVLFAVALEGAYRAVSRGDERVAALRRQLGGRDENDLIYESVLWRCEVDRAVGLMCPDDRTLLKVADDLGGIVRSILDEDSLMFRHLHCTQCSRDFLKREGAAVLGAYNLGHLRRAVQRLCAQRQRAWRSEGREELIGSLYRNKYAPEGMTYQEARTTDRLLEAGPWWVRYRARGRIIRESTGTENKTVATRFLTLREGAAAEGRPVTPRADKVTVDMLAEDLRTEYKANERRSRRRLETSLDRLLPFFGKARAMDVMAADVNAYVTQRQAAGAANGTIKRELAALRRLFSLAVRGER